MSSSFFPTGKGIGEKRFRSMHRQRSVESSVSSSSSTGGGKTSSPPITHAPSRPRRITMAGMIYDVRTGLVSVVVVVVVFSSLFHFVCLQ